MIKVFLIQSLDSMTYFKSQNALKTETLFSNINEAQIFTDYLKAVEFIETNLFAGNYAIVLNYKK